MNIQQSITSIAAEIIHDMRRKAVAMTSPALDDVTHDRMVAEWLARNRPTVCEPRFVAPTLSAAKEIPDIKEEAPEVRKTREPASAVEREVVLLYSKTSMSMREVAVKVMMPEDKVRRIVRECGAGKPHGLYRRGHAGAELSDNETTAVAFFRANQPLCIATVASRFGIRYERMRRVLHLAGVKPLDAEDAARLAAKTAKEQRSIGR